jgi:hypothetical protein
MPRPSKKTPELLQRIRGLHSGGASAEHIARETRLDSRTVRRYLTELGLLPNVRGCGRPSLGVVAAASVQLDTPIYDTGLESIQARRKSLNKMVSDLEPAVRAGTYAATTWAQLVKLERDLGVAEKELTPPAPPDANDDPLNVQAAAEVRERFAQLVTSARATVRCVHCGESPYAAV